MRRVAWLIWLGPALWLSACAPLVPLTSGAGTPTSLLTPLPLLPSATVTSPAPSAAPTASRAAPTRETPEATATLFLSLTAAGSPTGRPAPGRTATPAPACANDAEFLADLTVPDGAQFLPGQTFVKKWSVQNTGTCDWGPSYRLVFISGEALTAAPGVQGRTEFALYPARAGAQAVWEVPMRAPEAPGEYVGRWQARDPQGNLFGGIVFIKIEVVPLPAPP